MSMDRNLQAFLMVVSAGNLSRAAQRMALTQPALTKRLANLEAGLGAQLFERLPKGMRLSPAGKVFLAHAQRIEREYSNGKKSLRALEEAGLETVRIGAGPLFHLLYAAPLFRVVRDNFPFLKLDLRADINKVTLPMLLEGKLDVVLGAIEPMDFSTGISVFPVAEVEQAVLVHNSDPLAHRKTLDLADIAEAQWVIYSSSPDAELELESRLLDAGLGHLRIVARSTSFATALELVRELRAKMSAPLQLAHKVEPAGLKAIPTRPPGSRFLSGAYVRHSSLDKPAIAFLIDKLKSLVE